MTETGNLSVIKVGPYFYSVKPMPDVMRDKYEGLTEPEKGVIYLRTDLPHERREVTYWHEVLHAMFDLVHTGLDTEQEETVVDSLAPALVQLLDDNAHIRWGWMERPEPEFDPEGGPHLTVVRGGLDSA